MEGSAGSDSKLLGLATSPTDQDIPHSQSTLPTIFEVASLEPERSGRTTFDPCILKRVFETDEIDIEAVTVPDVDIPVVRPARVHIAEPG